MANELANLARNHVGPRRYVHVSTVQQIPVNLTLRFGKRVKSGSLKLFLRSALFKLPQAESAKLTLANNGEQRLKLRSVCCFFF